MTALRDRGEVFLTPTLFNGHWGLRAAFSNWRTQPADLQRLQAELARVSELESFSDMPERRIQTPRI